ncbi:hypothetical protein A6V37_14330 [Paraburkholderia ginsengiterrae]|uniref:Uncharacterized protein n=1 Tax=Paraburkholderia ginsengiterrae TaxID=1462993 RepID=A0A1A9NFT2_9BURK|nr:hypothetical protein A6V37_14330 [Paraburkholderia ginsengiterrae]
MTAPAATSATARALLVMVGDERGHAADMSSDIVRIDAVFALQPPSQRNIRTDITSEQATQASMLEITAYG